MPFIFICKYTYRKLNYIFVRQISTFVFEKGIYRCKLAIIFFFETLIY